VRAFLTLLLTLLLPLPAAAWNSAGHRLIASIAWDQLDEQTRFAVTELLRQHPDYERWIKNDNYGDAGRTAFIEASTWPDEIRQDERFFNPGNEAPTPALPGFPDMQRHRDWHYVNRPLDNPDRPAASGLLDKQLPALASIVGSPARSATERSYALPWLIHLTGDAHQPLHTVERGGNDQTIIDPFNPRKGITTLHAYWDDLPGPPWLRGARLAKASKALIGHYPKPEPSSPAQWLKESWIIAKESAYPPDIENVPTINETFYENSREIANRRVTEAAYRLAELLRELLLTRSYGKGD
jgi:hypothetical protein